MNFAIFASGSGTNFAAILKAWQEKKIPGKLALLFCDQPTAPVVKKAQAQAIPCVTFTVKSCGGKLAYEKKILAVLKEYQIDWLVLAGYMRIVGSPILTAYPQKIINIHPALLPNFPGLHGIEDAFAAGVSKTGVTIHYVDSGVDTGPVICQEAVAITSEDTLASLATKIHAVEHRIYPQVLQKIFQEAEEQND